jgi:acetylornithine deacetylase/succinyl-diaminopimelate desuccinylase-like protein
MLVSWKGCRMFAALVGILLIAVQARADSKSFDWDAITREAAGLLSSYIKIDTTNPPGNELPAAKMLKEKFLSEGIPAAVFEPAPGRGIVAARLRGIGKHRKTLILLSHMDVAPANPREWKVAPFSGELKNGEIWGRGALDGKGPGVIDLMAMLAIKRARILLDRDVLFIATGDEELGGQHGAQWLTTHQTNLYKDAGYVLDEGGGLRTTQGHLFYSVAITEKSPLWLRLTAAGSAGYGAVPPAQTAVTRIVAALQKLIEYQPPFKILPLVQDYYHGLAALQSQPELLDLRQALTDANFAKQFVATPENNAMVRETIAPTIINSGYTTNIIPSTAAAELDCRLLPGEDPKAFIKAIREQINDDNITVATLLSVSTMISNDHSELMNAIATLSRRKDKDAPVLASMLPGFNDSHYFRQRGLVTYGFVPIQLTEQQQAAEHGANEKIAVRTLRNGIERMVELLRIMGGQ